MKDIRANLPTTHRIAETEAVQTRYALRIAACLSLQSEATSHELSERLRFGRERALERAREQRAAAPHPVLQSGSGGVSVLALGGGPRQSSPWWTRLASVLPLVVLLVGLVLIQHQNVRARIDAAAEIDLALLVDELPPTAYGDPGVLEFLKGLRD